MREEGRTNKSSILLSHSFLFPFVTPDLTSLHFAEHLNTSVLKCRGTKTWTWHRWKTNPTPSVCISSWDQLCRQPLILLSWKKTIKGMPLFTVTWKFNQCLEKWLPVSCTVLLCAAPHHRLLLHAGLPQALRCPLPLWQMREYACTFRITAVLMSLLRGKGLRLRKISQLRFLVALPYFNSVIKHFYWLIFLNKLYSSSCHWAMSHSGGADLSTPRDYSHRDFVKLYFTFLEDLEVSWKYSKSGKERRKVKDTHLQPFAYRPWSCGYCHSISRNTHCLIQLKVDWKCNLNVL